MAYNETHCLDAGSLGKARPMMRDMVSATGRSRVGFDWRSHNGLESYSEAKAVVYGRSALVSHLVGGK